MIVVLEHVMVKTQPAAHGVRAVRPPSPHKIRPDKPYGLGHAPQMFSDGDRDAPLAYKHAYKKTENCEM